MEPIEALDELIRLLAADDVAADTPVRLPVALRDAAALAVSVFGVAPSTTAMTADALRNRLETLVMETALQLHVDEHPAAEPTLGDVALALAAQDGSPLADLPDLVASAADAVTARRPDASPDDVLLWAEAQLAALA